MKTLITLIVAIAFTLGSLFAFSRVESSDSDHAGSNHTPEKSEKAPSQKALLNYDFEFFSH
jgi:hypothetical protein